MKLYSKQKPLLQLTSLLRIRDEALLCVGEIRKHIPFPIRRFYLISRANNRAVRGLHAHYRTKQYLFCIQGKVTVRLDDGYRTHTVRLTRPNQGVLLDTMVWHSMTNFSPDAVLLVVASLPYNESDYIRDYSDFRHQVQSRFDYRLDLLVQQLSRTLQPYLVPLNSLLVSLSQKFKLTLSARVTSS